MFLEKYIIVYETTNRHSDSSTFLLKIVYTVLVRRCYRLTHGSYSQSPRQATIYIHVHFLSPLGRGLLAEHQGMKGLSHRWRGNRIYRWKWSVLGCFFCRTVDSRVGELLVKCGVHVGLGEQEWFRDTSWLSPASTGSSYGHTLVSLACLSSNTDAVHSVMSLCDSVDCSPPGSSDHEIFQPRILEWLPFPTLGEFSSPRDGIPTQGLNLPLLHLLYYWQVDSLAPPAAKSLQLCPTLCDPMDCCPLAPLSMGWSRQEYWSGLPCPPPKAPKYQYWGWRIFLYPHSLCCI